MNYLKTNLVLLMLTAAILNSYMETESRGQKPKQQIEKVELYDTKDWKTYDLSVILQGLYL